MKISNQFSCVVFTLLLISTIIISCDKTDENSINSQDINQKIEARNSNNTFKIKIHDYGDYVAIFEHKTGDFIFCNRCNASFDLGQKITDAIVHTDLSNGYVRITETEGPLDFVLYTPGPGRYFDPNSLPASTDVYEVDYVGFSSNVLQEFEVDSTFGWVPTTSVQFASLPSYECVPHTSSPCRENGYGDGEGLGPCDIGGEGSGATGFGTGSGATGFGTGQSDSCQISCNPETHYPCCYY